MNEIFPVLLAEVHQLTEAATSIVALQQTICDKLAGTLERCDWIGFYMVDPDDPSVLVLGPFHGEPTQHVRIPVTQGICGAAVVHNQTVIVQDVTSDPRYLSCSASTKSEIVTPIRVRGAVVGEIDVDSHTPDAFQLEDREFLEKCADIVGLYMEAL